MYCCRGRGCTCKMGRVVMGLNPMCMLIRVRVGKCMWKIEEVLEFYVDRKYLTKIGIAG